MAIEKMIDNLVSHADGAADVTDMAEVKAKVAELIVAVNALFVDRDQRLRAKAAELLPQLPMALSTLHAAPDGEELLTRLMNAGLIEIDEGLVVLTAAGRGQVEMGL